MINKSRYTWNILKQFTMTPLCFPWWVCSVNIRQEENRTYFIWITLKRRQRLILSESWKMFRTFILSINLTFLKKLFQISFKIGSTIMTIEQTLQAEQPQEGTSPWLSCSMLEELLTQKPNKHNISKTPRS